MAILMLKLKWTKKAFKLTTAEHYLPSSTFILSHLYKQLLKNFHIIRDWERFAEFMMDWRWYDDDGMKLCDLIVGLNRKYEKQYKEIQENALIKAAKTQARNTKSKNVSLEVMTAISQKWQNVDL
ncbi:hypothetical protein C8Q75DRAFT_731286 [Abortiporus biennis]|nr:hypothetical protein C8Q75DRAFT_731286 [Abortiporus biennis]